jgi:hypothetical protein
MEEEEVTRQGLAITLLVLLLLYGMFALVVETLT